MAGMTIGFEGDDFSEFDTAPVGTSYDTNEDAAYIGTYGLEIDMAGTITTAGTESTALSGSFTQLRTGAWINIGDLSLTTSKTTLFLNFEYASDAMGSISLEEDGAGTINARVGARKDSGFNSEDFTIPNSGWFHIETIMTQAATNVSNDGVFEIKVDGTQVFIDSAVDNFDHIDGMQGNNFVFELYSIAGESGVTGSLYVDQIQWNDDGTELYDPPVEAGDDGIYAISLAIDREADGGKIWVSTFENGTLYARQFDAATLVAIGKTSLGSATLADVQSRDNVAYIAAGSDLNGFAYGNMVNPAGLTGTFQLIETTSGVTGTWSAVTLGWLDNDVLRAFHTTPELTGGGSRLYSGTRWYASGSSSQLYQGTDTLSYVNDVPFTAGGGVKHGAFDISAFYHIAVGVDVHGTGANRVLGTVPPYTEWTDITNNYPSGTTDILRFL